MDLARRGWGITLLDHMIAGLLSPLFNRRKIKIPRISLSISVVEKSLLAIINGHAIGSFNCDYGRSLSFAHSSALILHDCYHVHYGVGKCRSCILQLKSIEGVQKAKSKKQKAKQIKTLKNEKYNFSNYIK